MLWFGTPLIVHHESLKEYSNADVQLAGLSLMIYLLSLSVARRIASEATKPSERTVLALDIGDRWQSGRIVSTMLFGLLVCTITEWSFVNGSIWPLIARLPQGSVNIIRTGLTAGECGATFLFAFLFTRRSLPAAAATLFGILLLTILAAKVASILLSSCVALVGALLLGLYLGSGKVPLKLLVFIACILSFLNLGKFEMRSQYWGKGAAPITISQVPAYFTQWSSESMAKLNRTNSAR